MDAAANGGLTFNGSGHTLTWVGTTAGVSTYTLSNVEYSDTLSFSYNNVTNASGPLSVTASIETIETDAANPLPNTATKGFDLVPVPDGFVIGTITATGNEDTKIQLAFAGKTGLSDLDGSESVTSILLKNVPVGYIVISGADASSATMVSNLGDDGSGKNTWKIPAVGNDLPAYMAIVPPEDVSGNVTGLSLQVTSIDNGVERTDTKSFNLQVIPVADAIDPDFFTPTKSFGNAGLPVALNLNLMLEDMDNSETVTLKFTGMGAGAVFVDAAGNPVSTHSGVTVDYTGDTYTLTHITAYDSTGVFDVNNLFVVKADPVNATVTVRAQSVETANGNTSALSAVETFTLDIAPFPTAGDDIYLYKGDLYDGEPDYVFDGGLGDDMVRLASGVNLNPSDFARFKNIETIDLTASGINSINGLTAAGVTSMTDADKTLYILGDVTDTVQFVSGNGWSHAAVSGGYELYTNSGDAAIKVFVQSAIQDSIV